MSMTMEVLRDLVPFLFALKQFGDMRAALDLNKPIQIHIYCLIIVYGEETSQEIGLIYHFLPGIHNILFIQNCIAYLPCLAACSDEQHLRFFCRHFAVKSIHILGANII